jgi:hypothetical protein
MKSKVFILILIAVFTVHLAQAQEKAEKDQIEYRTLFKNKDKKTAHGGYAALTFGYTDVDSKAAMHVGGRLAWVINHSFAFGVAGKGFFNNLNKPYPVSAADYSVAGGYGGLFFQPIIFPKHPVHVSFPVIIGAGGVTVNPLDKRNKYHWDYDYNYSYNEYDYDYFFVIEPGVEIEFNLLRYLRMAVGASYRFTNNVNVTYDYIDENTDLDKEIVLDQQVLHNFSINMSIMFGWF